MPVKLQLEITLDSKGAVVGVVALDKAVTGLDKTTQQATKSGKGLFDSIFAQVTAANLATKAIGALTGFVKDSFGAYMEAEAKQADMEATMRTLGIATEANIAKFTAFADSILKTTTIDDEAAKSMISLGLTMRVTSDRIEEAVKGAIGLGKAFGLDAQAAMKGVSAAMQGNFTLLGRYIPALQSAKDKTEKWALVQKAMEGGFRRETESINTSLGAWEQFQNQIGEAKEAVGGFLIGALKWLYDAREAIAAAAIAMGTLFVIGNISAWSTAISGALSSMIAQLVTANTTALTLKLTMGQIALVGAAAFVGWKIGERIGEVTGLNKVTQDYFYNLVQTSIFRSKSTAELSEHSAATAQAVETIKALSKTLGDTSGSLGQNALSIYQNKEAFAKLSPEIQVSVTKLANARQAFLNTPPAVQGVTNSLSTFALILAGINPALAGLGKAIDIAFQTGMQDRIIAHAEAVKKAQEAYEAFGKSLGFLSNTAMRDVDTQTKSLVQSIKDYGPQLNVSGDIQKKVWEEAINLMQAYIQTGKPIPQGLQAIIDKYKSMITLQKIMRDIKVELPDGKILSDSWVDPLAKVDQELNNFFGDMDAGRPVLDEFGNEIVVVSGATEKWYKDAQDLAAGLMALENIFNKLIPGLGGVISRLMGAYEITIKFAAASKAGTATLGDFLGMAGAVIDGFMALGNAYDAYVQGQQRNFIKGMNEAIDISDEMAEKIRLLAQEMSNAATEASDSWAKKMRINIDPSWDQFHAAASQTLGDLINQTNMSADTFDEWAKRTREILSDFDRGILNSADTTAAIGDAFTALISKAQELGTEGSASLIAMFEDLKSRGMEVKEVQEYINAQMAAGLTGYKAMKAAMDPGDLKEKYKELKASMAGMSVGSAEYKKAQAELIKLKESLSDVRAAQSAFGGMNIQVYEDMIAYDKKIAAHPAMTNAIAGATEALIGLSNTTRLSEGQFDQFEKSASVAFKKLTKEGFTSKESYQQLAPMLARLKFLHEQYGLTLDASTEKLLEGADAAGVNTDQAMTQEEAFTRMTGALEQMVVLMGGTLPDAIGKTTEALGTASGAMGTFTSGEMGTVGGATIDAATEAKIAGMGIGANLAEGLESGGFKGIKKSNSDLEIEVGKTFAVNTKAVGDFVGSLQTTDKSLLKLPKSVDEVHRKTIASFDSAKKSIANFSDQIDDALKDRTLKIAIITSGDLIKDIKPVVHAASGLYSPSLPQDTLIQAHRGESVNITPTAQNSGGGNQRGNTTNINITISGRVTPESVADAITTAYNGNVHSLKSTLQGGK